jgi:hypothetical protein
VSYRDDLTALEARVDSLRDELAHAVHLATEARRLVRQHVIEAELANATELVGTVPELPPELPAEAARNSGDYGDLSGWCQLLVRTARSLIFARFKAWELSAPE